MQPDPPCGGLPRRQGDHASVRAFPHNAEGIAKVILLFERDEWLVFGCVELHCLDIWRETLNMQSVACGGVDNIDSYLAIGADKTGKTIVVIGVADGSASGRCEIVRSSLYASPDNS